MKYLLPILAVSALAFAVPATAQIVNGNNAGTNTPAPIGTKGGGSDASMQAPGERQAVKGALINENDSNNLQPTPAARPALRPSSSDMNSEGR